MTQGNLVFVKREKDLLWGVAGFLLGLGLLVFSEMKSVYSWVFLFVLFWFANLAVFRPKKRRESFSRREECAILTSVKRGSKTREQNRLYGQLHARFTWTPYCRGWDCPESLSCFLKGIL